MQFHRRDQGTFDKFQFMLWGTECGVGEVYDRLVAHAGEKVMSTAGGIRLAIISKKPSDTQRYACKNN